MTITERQEAEPEILCRKEKMTYHDLAQEFDVSTTPFIMEYL